MALKNSTVYSVKLGTITLDSFSTETYLTDEAAIREARIFRDRYNESELGKQTPCRIVRGYQSRIVKLL